MTRIFVSYRREDAAHATARLSEKLKSRYGKEAVFLDIDNIDLGLNFQSTINEALQLASIVIVVIGRQWLSATDSKGRTRISQRSDYVRQEIAAAIRLKKAIVPILLDGQDMPLPEDMPEPIRPLSAMNGAAISYRNFDSDIDSLITRLDRLLHRRPEQGVNSVRVHQLAAPVVATANDSTPPTLQNEETHQSDYRLDPFSEGVWKVISLRAASPLAESWPA